MHEVDPVDQAILTRRSVGRVSDEPVSEYVARELIALCVRAPNHHRTTPWRCIVLTGAARTRIGAAHGEAYRRTHPNVEDAVVAREAKRLERAPLVIVVVCRSDASNVVQNREDRDAVAAGVQNMLLGAHVRGLGAIWRTGTMVDEPEVHTALGLDSVDDIVAFVYIGHPDAPPAPRPLLGVDDVTRWMSD